MKTIKWFIQLISLILYANYSQAENFRLTADSVEAELPRLLSSLNDGDSITLPIGNFTFDQALSIVGKRIALTGAGKGSTRLNFSPQRNGAQSVLVRGWDIALRGFSIQSPLGDGLVVRNSSRIALADIGVDMYREDGTKNGAYGVYPVASQHITMTHLSVSGASDAGIYLGQSKYAKIVDSEAYGNVTGINIENSISVLVENNSLHNNTVGLFVTSLPDMIHPSSHTILLRNNAIYENNKDNFSPKGTLASQLQKGVGIMLIATKQVSIEGNHLQKHALADLSIKSYYALDRPPHPGPFDPFTSEINIGKNRLNTLIDTDASSLIHICFFGKTIESNYILRIDGKSSKPVCYLEQTIPYNIDVDNPILTDKDK